MNARPFVPSPLSYGAHLCPPPPTDHSHTHILSHMHTHTLTRTHTFTHMHIPSFVARPRKGLLALLAVIALSIPVLLQLKGLQTSGTNHACIYSSRGRSYMYAHALPFSPIPFY